MDLKYGDRPRGNILGAFLALCRHARASYGIRRSAPFTAAGTPLPSLHPFSRTPRDITPDSRTVNANAGHTQYGLDLFVSVVTKLFI